MPRNRKRTEIRNNWPQMIEVMAQRILDRAADTAIRFGRAFAPKETGRLARAVRVLRRGRRIWDVGVNTLIYARQREFGGVIRGKNRPDKMLIFYWAKRRRWFRGPRVRQKGSHFLRKATRATQRKVPDIVREVIRKL